MRELKIVIAGWNDLDAITELYASYSGEEMARIGFKFDKTLLREHIGRMVVAQSVMLAYMDGEMIGFMAGMFVPCGFSADVLFVSYLFYVKPGHRRYSTRFLAEAEKTLKATPATKFVMASPAFDDSAAADRFYRMKGFGKLETHFVKELTS